MCKAIMNVGTGIHLRNGLVVVKSEMNYNINSRVNLTRKTLKSGEVKYGVTLTNLSNGRHTKMHTYGTIERAWNLYKTLRTA